MIPQTITRPNSRPQASEQLSVSNKIFRAQHENTFSADKKGPVLELFFHEIKDKETSPKHFFDCALAIFGLLFLVILYPFIAIGVKMSSSGPVIRKIKTEGKSGNIFTRYEFNVMKNSGARSDNQPSLMGKVLLSTGLYKLPVVFNILKDEMSVVGPLAFDASESTFWNNIFDDFFKRHAVKPGLVPVYKSDTENPTEAEIHEQIRREFKYIVRPNLSNDLKIIYGRF